MLLSGDGLTLPNDKILDWSKLKALAEDKIIKIKVEICIEKGTKHSGTRRKC